LITQNKQQHKQQNKQQHKLFTKSYNTLCLKIPKLNFAMQPREPAKLQLWSNNILFLICTQKQLHACKRRIWRAHHKLAHKQINLNHISFIQKQNTATCNTISTTLTSQIHIILLNRDTYSVKVQQFLCCGAKFHDF
jgi:hypothetical protein